MRELEIELTIPSGMRLKGVRTAGNTIIAVVEPEPNVRRIGFITEPPEHYDSEDEYVEDTIHSKRK